MLDESPLSSSIDSSPDPSPSRSRDEALFRLLAAATATFDSDPDRSKACMQQAAELLRVSTERGGESRDDSAARGGLASWQAKRVVAYIESHVSLSFSVPDLARIVQLSVSHFSRAFKESFGQTPLAYVKARRIRHAKVIMLDTQRPLAQIALDCGMCDQAHFTRVFRKVVGISPSLWRRRFQSGPTSADQQAGRAATPPGSHPSIV